MSGPFRLGDGGVLMALRVTPKASRDQIEGLYTAADGAVFLKVKVRAAPDKGKANAAVTEVLAAALGLPRSSLSVVSGAADRTKTLLAQSGNPAALLAEIEARLKNM